MLPETAIRIGTIFDPGTTSSIGNGSYVREPFPGNIIPASRLDPNAVKLLALFPAPTQARALQQLQRESRIVQQCQCG